MSSAPPKANSKTNAMMPTTLPRPGLFGRPPFVEGEGAATYDDLFAGIHAAVKPVGAIGGDVSSRRGGIGVGGLAVSFCGLAGVSRFKNRPKRIFGPFSRFRVDY
jgi:hypothetical protein